MPLAAFRTLCVSIIIGRNQKLVSDLLNIAKNEQMVFPITFVYVNVLQTVNARIYVTSLCAFFRLWTAVLSDYLKMVPVGELLEMLSRGFLQLPISDKIS